MEIQGGRIVERIYHGSKLVVSDPGVVKRSLERGGGVSYCRYHRPCLLVQLRCLDPRGILVRSPCFAGCVALKGYLTAKGDRCR